MKLRSYISLTIIIASLIFNGCKKKDKEPEPAPISTPVQPVGWQATSGAPPQIVYRFGRCGNTVFAGNGSNGILKSTNEGANWIGVNNGFHPWMSSVVDVKSIGTTVFAAAGDGVYTSTDNGNNWSCASSSTIGAVCLATQGSTIFAGMGGGNCVFTSTNNASTWNSSSNGIPANTSISGLTCDSTLMLAIGTASLFNYSLFKSTDDGANWSIVNITLPASTVIYHVFITGGNCFVGTTSGNFRSTDSGNNWSAISSLPYPVVGFDINGTKVYALGINSVYVSNDNGITFSAIDNTGMNVDVLRSFIITENYIIVSNDNIYRRLLN